MKYTGIPVVLAIIITGLFSCTPSTDVPDEPEKPVGSLAFIIRQNTGSTPMVYDSMAIKYDNNTKRFSASQFPSFGYFYESSNTIKSIFADGSYSAYGGSLPLFNNYYFYLDAAGRPLSGIRSVTDGPSRIVNGGALASVTTTDSIRYTINNNGQITGVVFFDRAVSSEYYSVFRDTTVVTKGMLESYNLFYDSAGSVSKVHGEKGADKKWDIEYSYGSGKAPMLVPEKYIYMPNHLLVKGNYGQDFRMGMPMIQARHELLKIKITDLVTGQVSETDFTYQFRKDGYPDNATVKETGISAQNPSLTINYKLNFVYH